MIKIFSPMIKIFSSMIKIFSSVIKMCNAGEDDDEPKQGGFFLKSFAVDFDCKSAGVKIFQPWDRTLAYLQRRWWWQWWYGDDENDDLDNDDDEDGMINLFQWKVVNKTGRVKMFQPHDRDTRVLYILYTLYTLYILYILYNFVYFVYFV